MTEMRFPAGFPPRPVGVVAEHLILCTCQGKPRELTWTSKGGDGAFAFLWAWCPDCLTGWVHASTTDHYARWCAATVRTDLESARAGHG